MKFQPGQSGNPRGRPRLGSSLAECIRKNTPDGQAYIDELHQLATGDNVTERTKLEAIRLLLERGWGKPLQEIAIDSTLARVDSVTISRLPDDKLKQLHAAATVAKQILEESS